MGVDDLSRQSQCELSPEGHDEQGRGLLRHSIDNR